MAAGRGRTGVTGPAAGLVAILVAALVVTALAPSASAATRWPGGTVTYRDETRAPRVVREAVRQWNAATTAVRLVPARRGQRAQIRIVARPCPSGGPKPCANHPPDGRVFLGSAYRRRSADRPDDELGLAVVAHEIGHALGLPHSGACDLMAPAIQIFDQQCRSARGRAPAGAAAVCGPQRADARALIRLYGGRVRSPRLIGWCRHGAPPPPRATTVAPAGVVDLGPESAPSSRAVDLVLRNRGRWTWGGYLPGRPDRGRVEIVERVATGGGSLLCRPATPVGAAPTIRVPVPGVVRPGRQARVRLDLCAPAEGGSGTARLRLTTVAGGGRERAGDVVLLRWTVDRRPVARISPASAAGSVSAGTSTMTFADASTDDRGPVASRTWMIDGEPAGSEPSLTHAFPEPGLHTVALVVRDAAGQESDPAYAEVDIRE